MPKLVDARTEASLDTYETPQWLVGEVKAFFGGNISLDPCTHVGNPTDALYFMTEKQNGLALQWSDFDSVYVNSPYGRALKDWTVKCAREALYNDVEIIQLMPARFGSGWFKLAAAEATCLGVFNKRLAFTLSGKPVCDSKGRPTTAQFDACLAYYGPRESEFVAHFAQHLTFWQLVQN